MKVPEKLYLGKEQRPDKEIFHMFTTPVENDDIEYIRADAFIEKVYKWLKGYAFVDDNKNVNLPTLLHDFLKDSRSF